MRKKEILPYLMFRKDKNKSYYAKSYKTPEFYNDLNSDDKMALGQIFDLFIKKKLFCKDD